LHLTVLGGVCFSISPYATYYVYRITNIATGDTYIGQHNNTRTNYPGSGSRLQKDFKQWGKVMFEKEILEYAPADRIDLVEQRWIINEIDGNKKGHVINIRRNFN
jgi:hypothetical protein